ARQTHTGGRRMGWGKLGLGVAAGAVLSAPAARAAAPPSALGPPDAENLSGGDRPTHARPGGGTTAPPPPAAAATRSAPGPSARAPPPGGSWWRGSAILQGPRRAVSR